MFWLLNDLKKLNIENTYELSEWETRAEKLFAMLKENVSTDGFKRLRVLLNAYLLYLEFDRHSLRHQTDH